MQLKKLYSYTRNALAKYNMILENDKIAIGLSGGKDSLALLYALSGLSKFYPVHFDLVAIIVDLGFNQTDMQNIQNVCKQLNVPLYIVSTNIGEIVFKQRNEKNPCSLCSKMRKGALISKAKELKCTRIAYAHHKDDVIETMMMSMFYEGRFHTFMPVTYFEDSDLYIIRPLILISESEIIGFKNKMNLPVMKNSCPANGNTKREYIKNTLNILNRENPGIKKRLFHMIQTSQLEGWCDNLWQKEIIMNN